MGRKKKVEEEEEGPTTQKKNKENHCHFIALGIIKHKTYIILLHNF